MGNHQQVVPPRLKAIGQTNEYIGTIEDPAHDGHPNHPGYVMADGKRLNCFQVKGDKVFNFGSLPAELRNKIYRLVLIRVAREDAAKNTGDDDRSLHVEKIDALSFPSITQVNRQLRAESLKIHCVANEFKLRSLAEAPWTNDPLGPPCLNVALAEEWLKHVLQSPGCSDIPISLKLFADNDPSTGFRIPDDSFPRVSPDLYSLLRLLATNRNIRLKWSGARGGADLPAFLHSRCAYLFTMALSERFIKKFASDRVSRIEVKRRDPRRDKWDAHIIYRTGEVPFGDSNYWNTDEGRESIRAYFEKLRMCHASYFAKPADDENFTVKVPRTNRRWTNGDNPQPVYVPGQRWPELSFD